jgi:polar amino acid transport system substrate-binding protein
MTGCGNSDTSSDEEESTASAATSSEMTDEQETSGTFTVGFDQEFPPMGFVGDDGDYTGFDLDLAAEVASRLGLEFVAQPIDWDSKDLELESGTIDCIWNGFTMNGREDDYAWTEAYLDNEQVFVVRKDDGITSQDDLSGKQVEVQTDSSAEAALKDMTDLTSTFAGGTYQTVADYNTAMMDLESGAADAIAMDSVVANYQIADKYDTFEILDGSIANEEYGVGFYVENTELRDQVQQVLEDMAADGTMAEISTEWFGSDITILGK